MATVDLKPAVDSLGSRGDDEREKQRIMNPLEVLGEKHGPSKRNHNYLTHFWRHLSDRRESVQRVCEIGVQTGRSLTMWAEFFPNATIYGIDVDPSCQSLETERIRIEMGDQGDRSFLEAFRDRVGEPFDVVIDDGSHVPDHQMLSFEVLFPAMANNGVYVIEDMGVHDGRSRGYTIEYLKKKIDNINYWPPGFDGGKWESLCEFPPESTWWDRNVIGIAFYRYVAFITRGRNPQSNPYLPIRK